MSTSASKAIRPDQWLEQVPTFGGHSQFPPTTFDELLAGIGAAVDAVGGDSTMRYAAVPSPPADYAIRCKKLHDGGTSRV